MSRPVIRWKLQLADVSARQTPQVILDNLIDQCKDAWSYFVPGAPAYLDFNLKLFGKTAWFADLLNLAFVSSSPFYIMQSKYPGDKLCVVA